MPASDRPAPDPGRRSGRSREAILDAALSLAGELPWPQVTVEAIARRAGVGKATIYRWWPSRGAVVVDALAEQNARAAAYRLPDTGDLERDLAGVLRAIVDELADPRWDSLLRALSVEALLDEGLRGRVREVIFSPQLAAFAERFARARRAGQVDGEDRADDLEALELFVAPLFHRWEQGTAQLDHAYADRVAARACRALAP